MESPKIRSSAEPEEPKLGRPSTNSNRRLSFQQTVCQELMIIMLHHNIEILLLYEQRLRKNNFFSGKTNVYLTTIGKSFLYNFFFHSYLLSSYYIYIHFTKVLRTQRLMRVLKTMNNVTEVNKDNYVGPNIGEGTQHQRRGAKTLEKVTSPSAFDWLHKSHP